jgi:tetratricopeptide (TPR) repeat protein
LFVAWLLVAASVATSEGASGDANSRALARLEQTYERARAEFQRGADDVYAAWKFGQACADWAELARDDAHREDLAQQGIVACRRAIRLDSNSAPAHFYLAVNLGQLARTKLLGALKLVDEMEVEFLAAIALDPRFDYASGHRSLGLLYLEAPGWPTSIGNKVKARQHLERAVDLVPDFPENRLVLLEALLKWGERQKVREQIPDIERLLETARRQLTGEEWEWWWTDWQQRWKKIKAKAGASRALSPRMRD